MKAFPNEGIFETGFTILSHVLHLQMSSMRMGAKTVEIINGTPIFPPEIRPYDNDHPSGQQASFIRRYPCVRLIINSLISAVLRYRSKGIYQDLLFIIHN